MTEATMMENIKVRMILAGLNQKAFLERLNAEGVDITQPMLSRIINRKDEVQTELSQYRRQQVLKVLKDIEDGVAPSEQVSATFVDNCMSTLPELVAENITSPDVIVDPGESVEWGDEDAPDTGEASEAVNPMDLLAAQSLGNMDGVFGSYSDSDEDTEEAPDSDEPIVGDAFAPWLEPPAEDADVFDEPDEDDEDGGMW